MPAAKVARGSGRERLLDAALTLIGTKGLHALTMRDVADVAGMSLGSATYHFADREELLEAALERFAEDEITRCAAALTDWEPTGAPTRELMEAVFTEMVRTFRRPGATAAQIELYVEASRNARLSVIARRCMDAYRGLLVRCLVAAGVAEDDAVVRAGRILTMADGLALHSAARGDSGAIDPDARATLWLLATTSV